MKRYVIDTNLFFNMEAKMGLGDSTAQIMQTMTAALHAAHLKGEIEILFPPSIVEEIRSFFDNPQEKDLVLLLGAITIKSPNAHTLQLSSDIMHQLIKEYRERAFRGMKVAEEELITTAQMFMGKEALAQKEFQMTIGKHVSKLRDRFRNATRTGTIDSVADFELIILALEQNAQLISTDEGVLTWGRKMGVNEMDPVSFGTMLQAYL
ncbi:MAG: RNA ligase partner protein [bacterium]|nr:RNA ligase partner protein [bacterium]